MADTMISNSPRIAPQFTRSSSSLQANSNDGGALLTVGDEYTPGFNDAGLYNPRMVANFNRNAAVTNDNDKDKDKDKKKEAQKKEEPTQTQPIKDALWYADKGGSAIEDGSSPLESRKKTRELIDGVSKADDVPSIIDSKPTVLPQGVKTATKVARWLKPIAGLGDAAQLFTGGVEAYEVSQNSQLSSNQKTVEYSKIGGKTVGAIGGGTLGAYVGTVVGSTLGAVGGPVGIVVGGVAGSVVGGYIGDELGGAAGEYLGGQIATAIVGEEPKTPAKTENVTSTVIEGFGGKVEDTVVPIIRPKVDGESKTSIAPAKAIRDNVLSSFGYSDDMIAAYEKMFPTDAKTNRPVKNGFYIAFNNEEKWASADQVANMKGDTENAHINVGKDSVQHLKNFYEWYERQNP